MLNLEKAWSRSFSFLESREFDDEPFPSFLGKYLELKLPMVLPCSLFSFSVIVASIHYFLLSMPLQIRRRPSFKVL